MIYGLYSRKRRHRLDHIQPTSRARAGRRRPALVLSSAAYNRKVGLALLCPITSQIKDYPFEVIIPDDLEIRGAILSDQVKSLDWKARFGCKLPTGTFNEVVQKLSTLIRQQIQNM